MRRLIIIAKTGVTVAAMLLVLASCGSTKHISNATLPASSAAELIEHLTPAQPAANMTARCSYDINVNGKEMSLSGHLRMQRDRLIQLSITAFGFEVARIEFAPATITIIDRYHKQYIQGRYDDVAFAVDNHLDFNVAQALFWGELFTLDGTRPTAEAFTLTTTDGMGVLTNKNAELTVTFATLPSTGDIAKTTVTRNTRATEGITMEYGQRTTGQPTSLCLSVNGQKQPMTLTLSLSSLKQNTGSEIQPTEIDRGKYKQIDPQTALSTILKL